VFHQQYLYVFLITQHVESNILKHFSFMAFLPQVHNTEVITKLLVISYMVFGIHNSVHHDCYADKAVIAVYIYIYTLRGSHFALCCICWITRAVHTLDKPLE
jgi:hypothetical protein